MPITTCIFDAYGTLFDVNGAAREAAAQPGNEALAECWPQLAFDWRRKQLEYTWLRAITREHRDFWRVTKDSLDWALAVQGLDEDESLRDTLLNLYMTLPPFEEVPKVLEALKLLGLHTAILSNGTPDMLDAAVASAGLDDTLDDVLSVETVGIYKPAPEVYGLVGERFRCARDEVLFVSSNGWDASGAKGYGFITAWVNRNGEPRDRLGHPPHEVLSDLSLIPEIAVAIR